MGPSGTGSVGRVPHAVLSMVLAGGEGKRLLPLTLDRAKPAVPFGGHYRLIDFALSNLANARLPAGRGTDAVQEPQPRPAHLPHLAALHAPRQLRDNRPGPDAPRPLVVCRLGRRHLPEPEHRRRRAARLHPAFSEPTTSTGWTRARCCASTSRAGPAATVAAIAVPRRRGARFRRRRARPRDGHRPFRRKAASPPWR